MANEVYVLNEGIGFTASTTPSAPTDGTHSIATSTNPTVLTTGPTHAAHNNLNFYEIYDGNVAAFGGDDDHINTTSTINAQETPGYRVQLDTGDANGFTLSPLYHYFVLVHSDSIYKHHFAKLTEQTQYDGQVYNIDFTPRLKENIPVGTQVKIYKGPAISSSIVALGYGLINQIASDGNDERHDYYAEVSLPTFYFFNNDRLEPNRKYTLWKRHTRADGSLTYDTKSIFKTAPITSDYILDKSFYTLNATIVDNNKNNDNRIVGASTYSPLNRRNDQGVELGYVYNRTDWDSSSKNIYHSDSGHTTYIGFIDSPENNQSIPSALNTKTSKTVTNRGNIFESKFSDVTKFMDKKIHHNERVKVKNEIRRQSISYFPKAELFGVYNNGSLGNYIEVSGLLDGQDLRTLLYNSVSSKYELILIGDYYYLPSGITAPSSGTQVIIVTNRRAITSPLFEGSNTVASMTNASAFRKEWSPVVSNFITTHDIDTVIESGTLKRNGITLTDEEADINGLEYNIANLSNIIVSKGDKINGYVEFESTPSSSYYASTDLTSSLKGTLTVDNVVYSGRIETIEKKIEMGAHYLIVSGRDDIGKLLSFPVNKNYNYSRDYVYSTITPFTDTITDCGLNLVSTRPITTNNVIETSGSLTVALNYGDVLYAKVDSKYIPIGVVSTNYPTTTVPGTPIHLLGDSFIDAGSNYLGGMTLDTNIYVGKNYLVAGKSSDISLRNTSATSLYGSLDKGYRLKGTGKALSTTGVETTTITSLNGDGLEIDNLLITQGSSLNRKDSPLGFENTTQLMNGITTMEYISSNINEETDLLDVEIGYVSPLFLARVDLNTSSFGEDTSNSSVTPYDNAMGLYLVNKNGLGMGGFVHLLNSKNNVDSSATLRYAPSTHKQITHDDRVGGSGSRINYSARFGSPIFRINNISPSALRKYNPFQTYTTLKGKISRLYFDNPAAYQFYGSIFRISGSETLSTTYYSQTVDDNLKSLPVERKGYLPTMGSTGHDVIYYPTTFKNSLHHIGPRRFFNSVYSETTANSNYFKRDQESYDPSILNAFLFSTGDMIPDSKLRLDNLFNTTINRNLTDYYLMVKYKSPTSEDILLHSEYEGTTALLSSRDNDYEYFPIESDSGINPKRISLLRLRTMTIDSLFNEVDFENYKTRTSFHNKRGLPADTINSIPNHGISVYPCHTTSATSSSSNTISVDNSVGLRIDSGDATNFFNRYIYTNPADDSTGKSRILGIINTQTSTVLTLRDNCQVDGYSGEIYVSSFDLSNPYSTNVENSGIVVENINLTGEDYKYPASTGIGKHNPNIHQINGSTITLNNAPNFTNRTYQINSELHSSAQSFRTYGAENHSTSANLQFSGADTTTHSNQTQIAITVENLSGINADLSHYHVGQVIKVLNHSTTNKNTFYEIISKSSNVITGRTLTSTAAGTWSVSDPARVITLTTGNTKGLSVGMEVLGSNIASGATIASITGDTTFTMTAGAFTGSATAQTINYNLDLTNDTNNVMCVIVNLGSKDYYNTHADFEGGFRFHNHNVDSRFLTDISTPLNDHNVTHQTFRGLGVVVAKNGGSSLSSHADNSRLYTSKLKNITVDNNYGTTFSSSSGQSLTTSSRYFGNPPNTDAEIEKDVAELLFVPRIDLAIPGVNKQANLDSSGNYDDYGYIYIDNHFTVLTDSTERTDFPYISWINYVGSLAGKYLINTRTNKLHYIVNHEINKSSTNDKIRHYLLLDNYTESGGAITGTDVFEVLTICNKTTHESKNKIALYEYDSTNVINPNDGKFYAKTEMERDWTATTLAVTGAIFNNNTPIVKGMYVIADVDGAGSNYLVHRDSSNLPFAVGTFGYKVCLSDSRNKATLNMDSLNAETNNSDTSVNILSFNEMKSLYGCVSIGELFNVSVVGKINREVEYVKIVLPFDVQIEAEEIADDIISTVGLTYNKSQDYNTAQHKKYYIGSNFDGQDSFSAVNSVLDYKDLKLIVDGEDIKIVSNETDKNYRSILFDEETNEYNISSFKRDVSIYDKFNSVVIIGDGVRGIAKNHTEIQNDGTERIKEIYDFSITSQIHADERAKKMLRAFSSLSNAIEIDIGSDVPYINPGQVVELKFEREGVFRGEYLVIEVHRQSGLPTKLLLGQYNKDLATTLSLLLGETRNLQGRNKQVYKSYTSPSLALQKTRLKFVKATITKGTTQSTVLGFGNTIGFDSGMGL